MLLNRSPDGSEQGLAVKSIADRVYFCRFQFTENEALVPVLKVSPVKPTPAAAGCVKNTVPGRNPKPLPAPIARKIAAISMPPKVLEKAANVARAPSRRSQSPKVSRGPSSSSLTSLRTVTPAPKVGLGRRLNQRPLPSHNRGREDDISDDDKDKTDDEGGSNQDPSRPDANGVKNDQSQDNNHHNRNNIDRTGNDFPAVRRKPPHTPPGSPPRSSSPSQMDSIPSCVSRLNSLPGLAASEAVSISTANMPNSAHILSSISSPIGRSIYPRRNSPGPTMKSVISRPASTANSPGSNSGTETPVAFVSAKSFRAAYLSQARQLSERPLAAMASSKKEDSDNSDQTRSPSSRFTIRQRSPESSSMVRSSKARSPTDEAKASSTGRRSAKPKKPRHMKQKEKRRGKESSQPKRHGFSPASSSSSREPSRSPADDRRRSRSKSMTLSPSPPPIDSPDLEVRSEVAVTPPGSPMSLGSQNSPSPASGSQVAAITDNICASPTPSVLLDDGLFPLSKEYASSAKPAPGNIASATSGQPISGFVSTFAPVAITPPQQQPPFSLREALPPPPIPSTTSPARCSSQSSTALVIDESSSSRSLRGKSLEPSAPSSDLSSLIPPVPPKEDDAPTLNDMIQSLLAPLRESSSSDSDDESMDQSPKPLSLLSFLAPPPGYPLSIPPLNIDSPSVLPADTPPVVIPSPLKNLLSLPSIDSVKTSSVQPPSTGQDPQPVPPLMEQDPQPVPLPSTDEVPQPVPPPATEQNPQPVPLPSTEGVPQPVPPPSTEQDPCPVPPPLAEQDPQPVQPPSMDQDPQPIPPSSTEQDPLPVPPPPFFDLSSSSSLLPPPIPPPPLPPAFLFPDDSPLKNFPSFPLLPTIFPLGESPQNLKSWLSGPSAVTVDGSAKATSAAATTTTASGSTISTVATTVTPSTTAVFCGQRGGINLKAWISNPPRINPVAFSLPSRQLGKGAAMTLPREKAPPSPLKRKVSTEPRIEDAGNKSESDKEPSSMTPSSTPSSTPSTAPSTAPPTKAKKNTAPFRNAEEVEEINPDVLIINAPAEDVDEDIDSTLSRSHSAIRHSAICRDPSRKNRDQNGYYEESSANESVCESDTDVDKCDRKARLAKGKLLNQDNRSRRSQFEMKRLAKINEIRQKKNEEEFRKKMTGVSEQQEKESEQKEKRDDRSVSRSSTTTSSSTQSSRPSSRHSSVHAPRSSSRHSHRRSSGHSSKRSSRHSSRHSSRDASRGSSSSLSTSSGELDRRSRDRRSFSGQGGGNKDHSPVRRSPVHRGRPAESASSSRKSESPAQLEEKKKRFQLDIYEDPRPDRPDVIIFRFRRQKTEIKPPSPASSASSLGSSKSPSPHRGRRGRRSSGSRSDSSRSSYSPDYTQRGGENHRFPQRGGRGGTQGKDDFHAKRRGMMSMPSRGWRGRGRGGLRGAGGSGFGNGGSWTERDDTRVRSRGRGRGGRGGVVPPIRNIEGDDWRQDGEWRKKAALKKKMAEGNYSGESWDRNGGGAGGSSGRGSRGGRGRGGVGYQNDNGGGYRDGQGGYSSRGANDFRSAAKGRMSMPNPAGGGYRGANEESNSTPWLKSRNYGIGRNYFN